MSLGKTIGTVSEAAILASEFNHIEEDKEILMK